MNRSCLNTWLVGFLSIFISLGGNFLIAAENQPPQPPGLADPGALQSISILIEKESQAGFSLVGRDASRQLVIVGKYASGQIRDLSSKVTYAPVPSGIVAIDVQGYATPLAEGTAEIKVSAAAGIETSIKVIVSHLVEDVPVNFATEIVPIFTKNGCNGGGCHGKSGGQNGFSLSLLGFEPQEDYEYLVKEARGRRLFPAAPDRSLLLLKASAQLPHGGGERVPINSPSYRLLRRWIEQGMPYGQASDPVPVSIELLPVERVLDRNSTHQLSVVAHYSDSSTRDVTRMAQFDSKNADMGTVDVNGLVTSSEATGSFAIMARFLGHVGVFRATVPLGVKLDNLPPTKNFIDEYVFRRLQELGLPPSAVCDDLTFLRRVTIDIAGRLPSVEEVERFQANASPNKRAEHIDALLAHSDYADYFTNKWNSILRNKRNQDSDKQFTFAFREWIRDSIQQNKPYNLFVREIITASGDAIQNGPAGWYREVKDASAQVEDTAQLFLGLRIQCARCHHHPFEKWSQNDYYGLAAFYSMVGRKKGEFSNEDRIYRKAGVAQTNNPRTGKPVRAAGLGAAPAEIAADQDPRAALADWLSRPDNPYFARSLVNRYWKHFFSVGLVDPEDDMRATNPPSNPELLDALATHFVESKYDLKQLVRTICNSTTYQLSALPNQWNGNDKQNFSRFYPRRLNAEVLLDAVDKTTGATTRFAGLPLGVRAVQLPDNGFPSYFLTVFGRPESSSACECERSQDANLAQSLHLLVSGEITNKLTATEGTAARLANDKRPVSDRLRELYRLALSRDPDAEEIRVATEYVNRFKPEDSRRVFEDIVWAMLNTKEFLFNH